MMSYANVASSNKFNAPLWTWVAAGCLALLFFGVSYYCFFQANSYLQFNPRRLERFTSLEDEKTLKVAVIGTSLTGSAFYKDEDMERFAKGRGLKIRFLRFTLGGGRLNEFYELSETVVNSGADLICFEAAIFGLAMGNDNVTLDRYRYYLRHGGTRLLARLPFVSERHRPEMQNENYTAEQLSHPPVSGQNLEMETWLYLKRISQFRVRDFSEGKKFASLLNLARERGKVVVFLDLSRSKNAWDMLPAGFEGEFVQTMRQYENVSGVSYLKFPQRLPLDYFQDFAHFNDKGRKVYSEWFLNNLPSLSGAVGK